MTIAARKAEAAAMLVAGQDIEIHPHHDDPGSGHTANPSPGIDPVVMPAEDWSAFADDTATAARGGRLTTNTEELEFAEEAADDGQIAYVTYWEESDPDNAPGVYDQWVKTVELTAPVSYSEGNRVYVPVGDLELFGAAAAS